MPLSANEQTKAFQWDSSANGSPFRFRNSFLLTIGSAALFALSIPGRPLPWLAWLALAPFFVALRRATVQQGFLLSGLMGWLIWFGSVWWLHAPLHDIVGMPISGAIGFTAGACLVMAVPYAVAGLIASKWRDQGMKGAARDAAIFTAAISWLTPVFQGTIAHTQYQYPVVLQVLELGGTPLLLFFMLWVNALLAEWATHFLETRRLRWQTPLAVVSIIAVVVGYGVIRLRQVHADMQTASPDRWFTVAAIQPNIPINVVAGRNPDPQSRSNDFFSALQQARRLMQAQTNVDLIALPENPATFLFNSDVVRREALGKLIRETKTPVLLNADAFDPAQAANGVSERYNVALWLNANRDLAGNYAKIKRIPMVEYLPGESAFPWLRRWFPRTQRVLAGKEAVVFRMRDEVQIIPLICYEGTVPSFTRMFVQKGGNFIVNQVNDSWFLRTPASQTHLALTLFRTIEYRVPLVRVTNSGISAHVQATGEIVPGSATEIFTATATAFPLYVPPQRSVYARMGNWWMFAFLLAFLPSRSRSNMPKP